MSARTFLAMLLVACLFTLAASPVPAQQAPAADDDKGLLPMIPAEAILFMEHRGHAAIHDVFLKSNLGKMYKDEAITQFVQDSRVRIGKMIMKDIFDADTIKTDPAELQQTLHKVTKAFWYRPAAFFAVPTNGKFKDPPGIGLICDMDEKSRAEAKPALDSLTRIGVPSAGMGARQAFKLKTGKLEWEGVALSQREYVPDPNGGNGKYEHKTWQVSSDPKQLLQDLKGKSILMTCWTDKHLFVATTVSVAEALGKTGPDSNKAKNESLARVLKKTAIKDWAFRWFVDAEQIAKLTKQEAGRTHNREMNVFFGEMGLPDVPGVGGTFGYADDVFTRMTFVDVPKSGGGFLGLLKNDGNYEPSLAMMPRSSTFILAGQLDTAKCAALARKIGLAVAKTEAASRQPQPPPPAVENNPPPQNDPGDEDDSFGPILQAPAPGGAAASEPAKEEVKIDEKTEKIIAQFEKLFSAGDGHVGMYITDIQGFAGMLMGGGMPVGYAIQIKDRAKASAAIDELVKLLGVPEGAPAAGGGFPPGGPGGPGAAPGGAAVEPPKEYRKVQIRYLAGMGRLGLMEDRIILALSSDAFKAGVDVALDKMGAPTPDSQQAKLLKLCGKGSAVFSMDLAPIAKFAWPLLSQIVENPNTAERIPFTSLPSTEKLVSLLGPEVAVIQPQEDGLLLKSRGKIPFATEFAPLNPLTGFFWYFAAVRF